MADIEEIRGAHQQAPGREVCRYCRFHWPCHPIQLADLLDRYIDRFGPLGEPPEAEASRPPTFYDHPRWGCGCDGTQCDLRMESGRDASADPREVLWVTCRTHGLRGKSGEARVADYKGHQLAAQAMQQLDLAHQEQCR